MNLKNLKILGLYLMAGFYLFGGINHFWTPEFYLPLIPGYLPVPELLNILAGMAEIVLGTGLLIPYMRKWAAWGVIAMLLAFIPSHVYFIQIGSCIPDVLCAEEWMGWVRLLLIHPLLIAWAWIYTRN
jgi:uncharacterized membrane protein